MRACGLLLLCLPGVLPAYADDALTLAGSSSTAPYARAWAAAYRRANPKADIRVTPSNSAAAPAALAENKAAIGMMSRPMTEAERKRVTGRDGKPPLEIKVAHDAVGIYVRKDNPLESISLAQIEQVFAAVPRQGGHAATWERLGLKGVLAERPIVAFGFDRGRGAYDVMRELALGGGEFGDNVSAEPVSTSVVQGVGVEAGGIGYASVYYRTARTRLVPVSGASGEAVAPSEAAILTGRYPLARYLYLYSSASASDATRAFLRFAVSDEGQALVRAAGGIPVAPELAAAQRAALQ